MKPLTVSMEDFCALVGIRRTKAFQYVRDQEVVVVRLGRRTLVTLASIEALIARNTINPDA